MEVFLISVGYKFVWNFLERNSKNALNEFVTVPEVCNKTMRFIEFSKLVSKHEINKSAIN